MKNKDTETYRVTIPAAIIDKLGWKLTDDVFFEITDACASHSCTECCPGHRDSFHEDSLKAITIHRVGDLTRKERLAFGFTSETPHLWDCPCCSHWPRLEDKTNG